MRQKWLDKQIREVLRAWKANEISLVVAARRLHALGFSPEDAWAILQKI